MCLAWPGICVPDEHAQLKVRSAGIFAVPLARLSPFAHWGPAAPRVQVAHCKFGASTKQENPLYFLLERVPTLAVLCKYV